MNNNNKLYLKKIKNYKIWKDASACFKFEDIIILSNSFSKKDIYKIDGCTTYLFKLNLLKNRFLYTFLNTVFKGDLYFYNVGTNFFKVENLLNNSTPIIAIHKNKTLKIEYISQFLKRLKTNNITNDTSYLNYFIFYNFINIKKKALFSFYMPCYLFIYKLKNIW